jgi:hypothetical protein
MNQTRRFTPARRFPKRSQIDRRDGKSFGLSDDLNRAAIDREKFAPQSLVTS